MDNRMKKKSENEINKGGYIRPSTSCDNNVGMNICNDDDEDDGKEKDNDLDESFELFMEKQSQTAKESKNSKKENNATAKDVKKKQYIKTSVINNKNLQASEVSTNSMGENLSQALLDVDHLTEVKKCPLCFKVFENNIINHVKSCSVKNKLSTKQLFGAVKLQVKQDKEREAMGLPVLPQKPVPKKSVKRKLPTTGLGSSVDLAIALSKSLKEAEERALIIEADLLSEAGLHKEATNTLQALEKCGLSSQPSTSGVVVSSVKSKAAVLKQQRLSILLSRSEKERERITTEKIAMVLMEDDIKMEIDKNSFRKTRTPKSVKLKKCHKEQNSLWDLATSKYQSGTLDDYYVESLGNVIPQSRTEPGCLLRHASQIPGRLGTPTSSGDARTVDFPDPEDLLNREQTINQTTVTSRLNNNTNNRNLLMDNHKKFQGTFISNWKTMFRNKVCSDITVITKEGQTIPVHRLVLYVRCKNILNSIVNNNDDSISSPYLIDWKDVSHESASIFLKFLYCCEFIEDILKLPRNVLDDLLTLIVKYNVKELEEICDKSKANDHTGQNNEHLSVSKNNFKRNLFSENRVRNEQSCDEVNLNSEPNINVLNSFSEACRSYRNEDESSDDSNSTVINKSLNFSENENIKTKRISFENIKQELFNDRENERDEPKSDSNSDINHRLPKDLKKSSIINDKQNDDTNYDSDTTVVNQRPQNRKNVCQRKTIDKLHDDGSDDSASTVINDVQDNHRTYLSRPIIKKSMPLSQDNDDYNLNKVQYYLNSIKNEDSNTNLNSPVNENVNEPSTSSPIVKNETEGVRDSIIIEDDEDTMDNDGFNQVVKMVIENEIREPASSQNVSSQDIFSEFNGKKINKDFHGALNDSNRKLNVKNSNENFRGLLNRSNSKRKSSENNDRSEVKRFCVSTSNETNLDSDGSESDNNMNETDPDVNNYSIKNISNSNSNVNNILENERRISCSNSAGSVDENSIDPVWKGFDDIVNDCYDHYDPGTPGRKMGDDTFSKSESEKLHINNTSNKSPSEEFMDDMIDACTPHNFSDFDGTAPSTSKMTSSNSRLDNRIGVNSYFFEGISDFVPNEINEPTDETPTKNNSHYHEVTENSSSVKAKVTSETVIENDEPLSISDCSTSSSVICLSPSSNFNTDNNDKEVKTKSKNSLLNDDLEIFDSTVLLIKNENTSQNYENNSINIDKENLNNSKNNINNYKDDDPQSTPTKNNNNSFLSLLNSDRSIEDINKIHESVKSASLSSLTPNKINKSSSVTNSEIECIITPRTEVTPDFKNMDEAELKRRLGQYGLKNSLGVQKARKLLTFIYNQLHPELPEDTLSDYKKVKDVALKYCNANTVKPNDDVTSSSSIDKNTLSQIPAVSSTQTINDSYDKQHTNSEESDVVDSGDEDDGSSSSNSDVIEEVEIEDSSDESPNHRNCNTREEFQDALKNYIRSNKELYLSVLSYKIVQLKDIAHGLKVSGYKFTLAELMASLDKEGVIYQTTSGYNLRKRRAVVNPQDEKKKVKNEVPRKTVLRSNINKTETDSSKTKKTATRGKNLVDKRNAEAAGPSCVINEDHVEATQIINTVKKNLNKTKADNSTLTNGDRHNSLLGKNLVDRSNAEAAGPSSFDETLDEISQFINTIKNNLNKVKADLSTFTNGVHHNSLPEWSCETCTFDNQSSADMCEMCGHSRNKSDKSTLKELMELEQCELIFNKEPFECLICFSECLPGNGILLRNCLHMFCRECLVNTVEFCEDPEVKCPFLDDTCSCTFTIQEREIKNIVSPEAYERHLAKSLSIGENQMRDAFHCKTADCRGWCIIDELTAADNVNFFLCPICNACNCLPCQAIHTKMNCKEYQEDLLIKSETDVTAKKTLQFIQKMKKQKKAMNCPRCNILVMKTEGCDWIQCSMCRTDICWATLGPRWGPKGPGDTSAGCRCNFASGKPCHPRCRNCH